MDIAFGFVPAFGAVSEFFLALLFRMRLEAECKENNRFINALKMVSPK